LFSVIVVLSFGRPDQLFSQAGRPEDKGMTVDVTNSSRRWLDLSYGDASKAQMLDIYLPATGVGPFPVILQIHGGAFMEGDKRDSQLTPVLAALDRGYAIVSINYRLSGEAHFPAAVQDVKAAIRWVRAHAARYSIDAERIATWGDSAGAHLAILAAVSPGVAALSDERLGNPGIPETVQSAVGWYGPYDFSMMDAQLKASGAGPTVHGGPSSAESLYLGAPVSDAGDLVARASPATYLTPDGPPMLLEAGTKDSIVPVEQSINFASVAADVVGAAKITLKLLEDAGHADKAFESPENLAFVLNWLDRTLKQRLP
jgi:acetyl esterase/lipase